MSWEDALANVKIAEAPPEVRQPRKRSLRPPREADVERRVCQVARMHGILVVKLVAALGGIPGMPDRLFMLPGSKVVFTEFKRPGAKISPRQEYRFEQLRKLGFAVHIIDSIEEGCAALGITLERGMITRARRGR